MLVPLHPVLDGAAHHHFLFFGQPIGITAHGAIGAAIEGLQRRWCPELCAPIGFAAVYPRYVHVVGGILFCR